MNNVRVAVCLVTYNQEKYIEQAINSVLEQKTTFPVDIIVGNDCSTDRTANVLQSIASRYCSLMGGGNYNKSRRKFRYSGQYNRYIPIYFCT